MSFETILVANRGEIALRIMRSCRRLGYRTVAVYSEADAQAPHVAAADAAVCIGAARAQDSYLCIPRILDAARASGAQALHPGYGFLSERAEFAQAVLDAGLVFIGPSPSSIAAMGNKRAAKRRMLAAGVPCIPGHDGADTRDDELQAAAAAIGLPVMIKAAAGGGGRGMRRVAHDTELAAAIASARAEAQKFFGSGELLVEKAVDDGRHVEIQVFGDSHGNLVHLGERDCSVQRRNQKLIEESPSPAVDAPLRERMGAAAIAAARAVNYVGAGTVEFMLAPDGQFYFLEMNTRLQVEHPVTEMIYDLDMVEWQLRVARGESLPLSQAQIDARRRGWAIEVRLCAEDPARNFLPQTGRVTCWSYPKADGLRIDHGLAEGITVSPYYDSMLGKLIAHGADRDEARLRLVALLENTVLTGIHTNRSFLMEVLAHPAFCAGEVTTGFISAHFPCGAGR